MAALMSMFTIYKQPEGYAGWPYVVKEWHIWPDGSDPTPGPFLREAPDLETARIFVPDGLYRMDAFPQDTSDVVETWL